MKQNEDGTLGPQRITDQGIELGPKPDEPYVYPDNIDGIPVTLHKPDYVEELWRGAKHLSEYKLRGSK